MHSHFTFDWLRSLNKLKHYSVVGAAVQSSLSAFARYMHVVERILMTLAELRRVPLRISGAIAASHLSGLVINLNATFIGRMYYCILVRRRLLTEEIYGQILIIDVVFGSCSTIVRRLYVVAFSDQRGTGLVVPALLKDCGADSVGRR